MLSIGDIVHLTLRTSNGTEAREVLELLSQDPEITNRMSPMPQVTQQENGEGQFGIVELSQEFVILVGAQLTAESIAAAIRACIKKQHPATQESTSTRVAIRTIGQGIVDITVDIESSKASEEHEG